MTAGALVDDRSMAERLADATIEEREAFYAGRTDEELAALSRSWLFWARPSQLPPAELLRWWIVMAGRGFGKNRTGSEWVLDRCEAFAAHPGSTHLVGLANATYSEVRALQVGGDSGLRKIAERRGHRLDIGATALEGAIRVWDEGWQTSVVEVHTADKPDNARGRNFATIWGDELSKWVQKIDSEGGTAFSNLDLGLRALCPKGLRPQGVITMTPKAIKIVRDLIGGEFGDTVVTRGSMFANRRNLAPGFISAVLRRYLGTRLGAQEIEGVLLDKIEGALWDGADLEVTRLRIPGATPDEIIAGLSAVGIDLVTIVVGVDPSGGNETECGIVVAGLGWVDGRPHLFVLDDRSIAGGADEWAPVVIAAAREWHADRVVAETNYGGDMVRDVIQVRDPNLAVQKVTATRGKAVRAEPVAALWAGTLPGEKRGHLVGGGFGLLEGELTTWVPDPKLPSPNRLDAMVWCGHALLPDLAAIDTTRAYGSEVASARL